MSSTIIPFTDPKAQKKWASTLAVDTMHKGYFQKKFIGKGDNNIIEQKTDLEADAGYEITFDLSVQLRGRPTTGDDRLEGNEESLRFYSDQVKIDQTRRSVSAGGRMTRKVTAHDLRVIAKNRLSDYWAAYMDQLMFIYLSGARGINEDFFEPEDYAGHAGNPIQAPDSEHILYGGDAVSPATISSADKMSRDLIERAVTRARMMRARNPKTANMMPVSVEGEQHYVCVIGAYQEHDLRTSTGETGWLEMQKAAAGAEGRKSPIFKGGLGMINNVVMHSHESVIRFNNYGAGGDLPASRSLFMGRQAGVLAYGVKSGSRFMWKETMKDFDNEPIVASGTILGFKKTRFNGNDFGVMAIDTYAEQP